ncbi:MULTISPECIES: hypothetical protein [Paenibacillus]|uniref:hypothetical protein n=1 Tax=Paenibacillus TaxID=44249 RepID=UPI0009A64745|nr:MULTISPECIES: hypothetical protein [Paenibacillus]MCZ1267337.1 hypothetical protein [Paenibacillus tundrae]SLJ90392.1 hypothetical protein SAMN06272722_101634 [Paenibacillus sp. RU5A]SOC59014.1 hypothetical protein SAMN05880581_101557 [Paenibacillus sp. RU26A]SOC68065.1 hypothetical protein SAMN05880586_101556 [Paenibacillus sp. RU5M]
MLQDVLSYFQANPGWSLASTVVCTVIIWLYKEFKVNIESDNKNKLAHIQKKMESYTKVEAAIAKVLSQENHSGATQSLYDKFGECSSYFSEDIRELIRDYYSRRDTSILVTLMSFMKIETRKLDRQKNRIESQDASEDSFDSVFRLYRPFKPILIIFIMFFVTIWFILLATLETSVLNQFYLGTLFITISLGVMFLFAIISVWSNGELHIRGKLDSSLKMSMILSPLLTLIDWRLSVLSLFIQVAAGILIAKSMKKRIIVV